MLKTIKGKVIAGTVSVALLSSVGVAYGASSAGESLQSWYNQQFGKAALGIGAETTIYSLGKVSGLRNDYNGLKLASTTEINNTKTAATNTSKGNIEKASKEHIDSITLTQAEIEKYMGDQFAGITKAAEEAIKNTGNETAKWAINDLTNHTGKKGEEALAFVNTELSSSSEKAIADLKAAIEKAKGELQTQLNTNKTKATSDIKTMIDNKIAQLRAEIKTKKEELVSAQQTLISAKAAEMEAAAKLEMDKLVSGIK
ncbi:hypothetical protein [Paenisporosarcina sp.]|jgi:hypothetical protein|uniref:hypothetical protein n=1 Tax=Paenisporosarcina sp. TaxID=1932001 RepID=UPI003C795C05